jgi:hypothetical protein
MNGALCIRVDSKVLHHGRDKQFGRCGKNTTMRKYDRIGYLLIVLYIALYVGLIEYALRHAR